MLNDMSVDLPLPFIFTMSPTTYNQNLSEKEKLGRNVILYDNAGEHFEPGRDSITNLATQHLIHSDGIFFLFDPFKDSRMVTQCDPSDPQFSQISKGADQVVLLNEMISRIRTYSGLANGKKYSTPLIIIVPKYDAWRHIFPFNLEEVPYLYYDNKNFSNILEIGQITNISFVTRELLQELVPEVVTTSENFFEQVYYLPVSSLGRIPEYDVKKDMIGIKPINLKPIWAEVPMLLQLWLSNNIKGVVAQFDDCVPIENYQFINSSIVYSLPNINKRETAPSNYWGKCVYSRKLNKYIKFPTPKADTPAVNGDDFWN